MTCFEFKAEFVLFFMSLPYPLESRFVSWRVKRLEKKTWLRYSVLNRLILLEQLVTLIALTSIKCGHFQS